MPPRSVSPHARQSLLCEIYSRFPLAIPRWLFTLRQATLKNPKPHHSRGRQPRGRRFKFSLLHQELELELDVQPLTRTPDPIPVRAWVYYQTIALKVDAKLIAWTPRACAIGWTTPTPVDAEHRAWVWANAIDKS